MKTGLFKASSSFVRETSEEYLSTLTSDDVNSYLRIFSNPLFDSNHSFKKVEEIKKIDFRKIVYEHRINIHNFSSYKVISLILKNKLEKLYSRHPAFNAETIYELIASILDYLLINYFELGIYNRFDEKNFRKIFKSFEKYVTTELFSVYFFSPVHQFEAGLNNLKLQSDLELRRVTSEEFATITGIRYTENKQKVGINFRDLKYVIGTTVKLPNGDPQNVARKKFEKSINALKLYKNGDIKLGGLYSKKSSTWNMGQPILMDQEKFFIPTKKYALKPREIKSLMNFFNRYYPINFTKGKYPFLDIATRRFSLGISEENIDDKIVDFVISLESLFSSKESELVFRFSNRVAALMGNNSAEKISLRDFMTEIYDVRSRIVHGNESPKIMMNGTLTMQMAEMILERLTRNSIKACLSLIPHFTNHDQLQKKLDDSLHDAKVYEQIKEIIKNETSKNCATKYF